MEQSTHYDVCVLGSANSDLFLKVKAFPKSGETINALVHRFHQGKDQFIKNGGKGANQAVASARLGSKNVFAGTIDRRN
jgi:ribokinase